MDDFKRFFLNRFFSKCRGRGFLLAVLLVGLFVFPASAGSYARKFNRGQPSWQIFYERNRAQLLRHRIDRDARNTNRGWEAARFNVTQPKTALRLEYPLPAAHVISDFRVALWFRSNRLSITTAIRVVLPESRDPQTKRVLSIDLPGVTYSKTGQWEQLIWRVDLSKLRDEIRRLRARLTGTTISTQGMYIDGIVLKTEQSRGNVEFNIYELQISSLVPFKKSTQSKKTTIQPITGSQNDRKNRPQFQLPLEFRLDKLRVNNRPFFPRIAAYHQESLSALKDSGMNVIWVPRFDDSKLLAALRRHDLWATAVPPRTVSQKGVSRPALLPMTRYDAKTAAILFWSLGNRIPATAKDKKAVVDWIDQIRRADSNIDRPIMGDVLGNERVYSRHFSMLGVSRHVLNTTVELKTYRNWLLQKRKLARPGSFTWTWIQTEPSSANVRAQKAAGLSPMVVEPEQIRLQVYAALAAGCRGIGYWKTERLDAEKSPGDKERLLAISQLNLELDLLAPWLSTGTVVAQTPFSVQAVSGKAIGRRQLDSWNTPQGRTQQEALIRERNAQLQRKAAQSHELEAAVIRSEYGLLLLPIWYQTQAQFCPGKMAAKNATIVVHGVSESATAWEVTTTGVRSLVRKRVTGGIQITIPQFSQTTAVILTSNNRLIDQLRQRIALRKTNGIAAKSAKLFVDLARAKLARVKKVNAELATLGIRQPDAPQLLGKAAYYLAQAETARKRNQYDTARTSSGIAMQHLRILQRAHWTHAIQHLSFPVSAPHTLCFQTLPEHWRLVAKLGRTKNSIAKNLLRSGDFEDFDTMLAEGWKHRQNQTTSLRAAAELYPSAHQGNYSLRMVAALKPGVTESPKIVEKPPVTVTTPKMTVRSGQLVQVSGWIRLPNHITGTLDGVTVYDNIAGPGAAIRFRAKSAWRRFSVIRTVQKSGKFWLTFSLTGIGECFLDDLRVTVHDAPAPIQQASHQTSQQPGSPTTPSPKKPRRSPLQFLQNRLPKFRGLQR